MVPGTGMATASGYQHDVFQYHHPGEVADVPNRNNFSPLTTLRIAIHNNEVDRRVVNQFRLEKQENIL